MNKSVRILNDLHVFVLVHEMFTYFINFCLFNLLNSVTLYKMQYL